LLERSWSEPLRAELGWLGKALGPARDLDVLREQLEADLASLGPDAEQGFDLLATLEAERETARAAVIEALTSDRYLALLDRLDHVSEPEPASGADQPPSLTSLLRKEWRRTRKAFGKLGSGSADDELHAARIRVKRARYAAELAAHELGRSGSRFVSAAKDLQDVLGAHQDAAVAEERVGAWADEGHAGETASRLIEVQHERKAAARASWPDVWKQLRRAGKRIE
jgi:CHAD domain-containing protein